MGNVDCPQSGRWACPCWLSLPWPHWLSYWALKHLERTQHSFTDSLPLAVKWWLQCRSWERPHWSPKVSLMMSRTFTGVFASLAGWLRTSLRAQPASAWISHLMAVHPPFYCWKWCTPPSEQSHPCCSHVHWSLVIWVAEWHATGTVMECPLHPPWWKWLLIAVLLLDVLRLTYFRSCIAAPGVNVGCKNAKWWWSGFEVKLWVEDGISVFFFISSSCFRRQWLILFLFSISLWLILLHHFSHT